MLVSLPDRQCQEIGNPDETRRRRVNEQRHLGKIARVPPSRSLLPTFPGESLVGFVAMGRAHHGNPAVLFTVSVPEPGGEQIESPVNFLEGTRDRVVGEDEPPRPRQLRMPWCFPARCREDPVRPNLSLSNTPGTQPTRSGSQERTPTVTQVSFRSWGGRPAGNRIPSELRCRLRTGHASIRRAGCA